MTRMSTRCWLAAISFAQCDAPYDECAHWTMAFALAEAGRLEEALYACDAGISLNPNDSLLLADKADYLDALGRTKEAIETCGLALQLDPRYPVNYWWENSVTSARFLRGEHAEALSVAKTVALKKPTHLRAGIVWAESAAASPKCEGSQAGCSPSSYCRTQSES